MSAHSTVEDSLLWYSPVVLIEVDLGGVIRAHNSMLPYWLDIVPQRESDLLVGRNFVEWLTASGRLNYETQLIPQLLQQKILREKIVEVQTETGTRHSVLLNANLVEDSTTGKHRIFLAIMDASERIRFEQSLIAAQRAAQTAEERLHVLQDATSRLAVAEGLDDLGRVLSETASRATLAAWSCVALVATASEELRAGLRERTRVWGTTPQLPFPILDLVRGQTTAVYRNPGEIREAFPNLAAHFESCGVEAFIVSPIVRTGEDQGDDELLGAIFNWFRRGRTLEADVAETFQALSVQAERVLEHLRLQDLNIYRSLHDGLTGLANRVLLLERLAHDIAAAQRTTQPCAVLFLDLDGFKAVNDHLGHGAGDEVLREVADRLRRVCRPTETLCRLGGDEFVVVCANTDLRIAQQIGNRVHHAIRQPFTGISPSYPISASIGALVWDPQQEPVVPSVDELLNGADAVMYAAKRSGKDRVQLRHWRSQNSV